jgi:hypothetical protein
MQRCAGFSSTSPKKAALLFSSRPDLGNHQLSNMQLIEYTAPGGLARCKLKTR